MVWHLKQKSGKSNKSISLSVTGQTDDGLNCVRFGLITEDTDLEELIALVYTTGKEVEESSKVGTKLIQLLELTSILRLISILYYSYCRGKLLRKMLLIMVPRILMDSKEFAYFETKIETNATLQRIRVTYANPR